MTATIYRSKVMEDSRGNSRKVLDEENPHVVKVWEIPGRSSRAEAPGDLQINVIQLGTKSDLDGVDLWSQVDYQGKRWDVVTPPAHHNGATRATRHWSFTVKERP